MALGGALALTLLQQIAYPLSDGEFLRTITISPVPTGAIAMPLPDYLSHGWKYLSKS